MTVRHDSGGDPTAPRGEEGLTTAELLGNAALGVVALLAIWTALQSLGIDIVTWIGSQLGAGA